MGSLIDTIKDPAKRAAVLDDCVRLIDAEVAGKRGLTGVAVKAAFKSVKGLRPGMVRQSMDALLDDFSGGLVYYCLDGLDRLSRLRRHHRLDTLERVAGRL